MSESESNTKPKKKYRKKEPVNEKLMRQLSLVSLPDYYIAEILEIPIRSLERKFGKKISKWKAEGKSILLSKCYAEAYAGNWAAMKFLMKNHLKFRDEDKLYDGEMPIELNTVSEEQTTIKDVVIYLPEKDVLDE